MSQVYYTGPIAKLIPGDIGLPVAASWTALVYPGLRVSFVLLRPPASE